MRKETLPNMSAAINFNGPYEFAVATHPGYARLDARDEKGNVLHLYFHTVEQAEALDNAALEMRAILNATKGFPS